MTEIDGSRRPTVVEVMEDDELTWYIIIFIAHFKRVQVVLSEG
jgi:hypothetical protein